MVKTVIDDNAIDVLTSMKGKTFKSYEGSPEWNGDPKVFYGMLRINLGREAIDVTNFIRPTEFLQGFEELSCFDFKKAELDSKYPVMGAKPVRAYMVDEKIKTVDVIRDFISLNGDEYNVETDTAIVITTDRNVYSITRDWYFGETLTVCVDSDKANIYEISRIIDDWSCGEHSVSVSRTCINL